MATKATQPTTQTTIKRARPGRDSLAAIADGIVKVTPELVDLAVESTKAVRLVATTVRLTMGEVVMEQLLDTMTLVETVQQERKYSDDRMSELAKMSGMEDVSRLIKIK